MELPLFDRINPYVRIVRFQQNSSLAGKWLASDHTFKLITAGTMDLLAGGEHYILQRGDVIILPPNVTQMITPRGGATLERYIIHFDFYEDPARCDLPVYDEARPVPEREKLLGGRIVTASLDEAELARFEDLCRRISDEFRDTCAGGGCCAMLRALCIELLIETLRRADDSEGRQGQAGKVHSKSLLHIENALEYIGAHYMEEDLNNERISAAIGVSPNYLTKRFHACIGMPMHRYLVRLRVEKAQQLLLSGRCNITEAAVGTGFSSIQVFSKTFKSVLGISPSVFQQRIADDKSIVRALSDNTVIERRCRAMQAQEEGAVSK